MSQGNSLYLYHLHEHIFPSLSSAARCHHPTPIYCDKTHTNTTTHTPFPSWSIYNIFLNNYFFCSDSPQPSQLSLPSSFLCFRQCEGAYHYFSTSNTHIRNDISYLLSNRSNRNFCICYFCNCILTWSFLSQISSFCSFPQCSSDNSHQSGTSQGVSWSKGNALNCIMLGSCTHGGFFGGKTSSDISFSLHPFNLGYLKKYLRCCWSSLWSIFSFPRIASILVGLNFFSCLLCSLLYIGKGRYSKTVLRWEREGSLKISRWFLSRDMMEDLFLESLEALLPDLRASEWECSSSIDLKFKIRYILLRILQLLKIKILP